MLPAAASADEWLAGDLHVHTCFSHDVYCGPTDDNTSPEEIYTLGLPVGARYLEASAKGLDYMAVTDHNDVRSIADPGFGTAGVIGLPAYENSLDGHAQMLGAGQVYPGDDSVAGVEAQAAALRADGGAFQINHPVAAPGTVTDCDPPGLDWSYGYQVVPDTLEVWNFATSGLKDSTAWWDCWLERGVRLPATGGSDSHWIVTLAIQGAGNPTTWAFAEQRSASAVLEAFKAGRTSISRQPPLLGGSPLLIEADLDRDGGYELVIGEEIPIGAPLRVRGGGPTGGFVRVRANGSTLLEDAPLAPGGELRFDGPQQDGWLRAELRYAPASVQEALGCSALPSPLNFVPCPADQILAALSSPVYVREPDVTPPPPPPDPDPDPTPGAEGPYAPGTPGTAATAGTAGASGASARSRPRKCRRKKKAAARKRCRRRKRRG